MLTATESVLRAALDGLPEGLQVIGFDRRYLYVNATVGRQARRPPGELIGRSLAECFPDIEGTELAAVFDRVMQERRPERVVTATVCPGGETGCWELFVDPVPDGICVRSVDATERQTLQEELRRNQDRTRFAMQAAGMGVCELNLETGAVYCSESLEAMAGLAPGQGPKTSAEFMSYVDPDDRRMLAQRLEDAKSSPGAEFSVEFRIVRRDGERRWVETHARFVADPGGRPQALLGIGIDVTDRRTHELQLQQGRKMEAIGRLAGGIAHDFNNLLTAILGYSELVLERVNHDPSLVADVEEIKKAGERAGRLTRQLLAFSRRQVMMPQVLDLNQVVLDLDRMLSRIIGEDIQLEILTKAGLDRTKADPGQIEQLLMNLVINARDAMPEGGALRVRTDNVTLDAEFTRRHKGSVPGRYVLLEVQDTGSGMGPEVLAHAFEPFFTTKGPGSGTGLGLATVYGIVKQSGGYVAIDSTLGAGTSVTTYLPVIEDPIDTSVHRPAVRTVAGTETVLLCEDDPGIRHLIAKTLAQHSYTVLEARDVRDAIAIASGHVGPIHLFLTDIVMPELNGPNLAQHVVRERPDIKVLYISGFPHSVAVGTGSLSSRATLLSKPFTPTVLTTAVRECLDR